MFVQSTSLLLQDKKYHCEMKYLFNSQIFRILLRILKVRSLYESDIYKGTVKTKIYIAVVFSIA